MIATGDRVMFIKKLTATQRIRENITTKKNPDDSPDKSKREAAEYVYSKCPPWESAGDELLHGGAQKEPGHGATAAGRFV